VEGPFGDHFGHYSEAADFPVFHIKRITRRRNAIYPASVVGKPPQEDKYMGIAAGEMVGPLIKVINPNIVDLWAFYEAGFHNLLGVALRERHPKEVLKTAFALLGIGQLSLTKVMILVGEDVNCRRFDLLLRELWYRFEPQERMLLIPVAPLDTLDFTSFKMHVGSKLVLDATGERVTDAEPPREVNDPRRFDGRIKDYRLLDGGFLVVTTEREPRQALGELLNWPGLGPVKFIAAVSPDVNLHDEENLIWGIFTRFDPARDMQLEETRLVGARPVYKGRIAIDATWKQGYPLPLEMDDTVKRTVDRKWREYGLGIRG
jgi:4-hydroxy-3-polyprenylbenzoate decarboxylase